MSYFYGNLLINGYDIVQEKIVEPIQKTKVLEKEDNTDLRNVKTNKLSLYHPDNISYNWSEDIGEE